MVTTFAVAALAYVLRPPPAVSPCAATSFALHARVAARARQPVCGVVSHDSDSSAHACPQCGKDRPRKATWRLVNCFRLLGISREPPMSDGTVELKFSQLRQQKQAGRRR